MALKLSVKKFKNVTILILNGRVIGVDSGKLKKRLESLYQKSSGMVVLDISKTEFIDSNGLGIVLYYHTLFQRERRELVLYNGNPSPRAYMTRLLEFTQLDSVFKVVTSLESLDLSKGVMKHSG